MLQGGLLDAGSAQNVNLMAGGTWDVAKRDLGALPIKVSLVQWDTSLGALSFFFSRWPAELRLFLPSKSEGPSQDIDSLGACA